MSEHRANAEGLLELAQELAGGEEGARLPLAFRPRNRQGVKVWFALSIEEITEAGTDRPYRALVITPCGDWRP